MEISQELNILNGIIDRFRFAQKNNLPILKNVSLPRVGAMRVIMENIGYSNEVLGPEDEDRSVRNHTGNSFPKVLNSRQKDGLLSSYSLPPQGTTPRFDISRLFR